MKLRILCLCLVGLIFSANSHGFMALFKIGQRQVVDYYGPVYPDIESKRWDQRTDFIDDLYLQNHSRINILKGKYFDINNFVLEYEQGLSCPASILSTNFSYIRYLNRLIRLSYLYESHLEILNLGKNLSMDIGKECQMFSKKFIMRCKPKSPDMVKFLARANEMLINKPQLPQKLWSPKKLSMWLRKFTKGKHSNALGDLMHSFCEGPRCKSIKQGLANTCNAIKEDFLEVCSETDKALGHFSMPFIQALVKDSPGLSLINQGGTANACIESFANHGQYVEIYESKFNALFESIFKRLSSDRSVRYVQGGLFLPGSLRLFDEKGLSQFFFKSLRLVGKPKLKPLTVSKVKVKTIPKIIFAKAKKVKKNPELPKKASAPSKPSSLTPFKTATELADRNLKLTEVNMKSMGKAYPFTKQILENLRDPLLEFQTRSTIFELKRKYQFGSKKAPVPLLFIWYLINEDKHQGLYNLKFILGDKFYVQNDLLGDLKPRKILINHNKNGLWKMNIIPK